MKIPVYENQIAPNAPTPQDARLATPPASAFPSSVHEAGARLGEVVTNIGSKLADHMIEFQKEQNEKALFKLDTDYGSKIDAKLFDPKEGLIATRKLGNAAGVTSDFNQFQKDTLAEIEAIDAPDAVKSALGQRAITRLENAKSAAVKYEAQQLDEDYKGKFNANIASQTRAMSYAPNAKSFLTGREMLHATIEAEANRLQVGDEVKARMFAAADEDALKAYLGANIEGNPKAALSAISQFNGSVDAGSYAKLEGMAKNSLFASTVLSSKMAGMGKDEIYAKYVAGEKDTNRQAEMATVVNKAFAERNYALYNSVWERVQKNAVTTGEIDQMVNSGLLPENDGTALRKDLLTVRGGEAMAPDMKIALDNLELKAKETWGNKMDGGGKASKVDLFKYVMKQEALKITDPAALYKRGLDLMKDTTIPTAHWWTNDDYPAYKVELERGRAEALADAQSWENAGASLLKHGELDTPANRKAVISAYKDGNY